MLSFIYFPTTRFGSAIRSLSIRKRKNINGKMCYGTGPLLYN